MQREGLYGKADITAKNKREKKENGGLVRRQEGRRGSSERNGREILTG